MILQTEISIIPLEQTIRYGDGLLFLGSCFADEVGNICKGLGFNALVNPFGVLYNPFSIAGAIHRLGTGKPYTHDEVIRTGNDEFYCTFGHNTAFWRPSEAELLETVNGSLKEAHAHFVAAKWVMASLGTSWMFRRTDTLEVVGNCHKLPSSRFERCFCHAPQTVAVLSDILKANPDKQFVFTVSPLRHLKDGLHENQLSKAALLLAVDEVCQNHENAHYFPAYEILLDELRDYRFYKEDMVHPTEQAVRHIWERFADFAINPSERPAMTAAAELKQMLRHKPLFPESEAFKQFEAMREHRLAAMRQAYPNVLVENLRQPA